jgi:hypothetical protein
MNKKLLKQHLENFKKLDRQRIIWLRLSAFVVLAVLGVLWDWNDIVQYKLGWLIGACGLIISVLWWYWTMIVIRLLIQYRAEETQILFEIVDDIKLIKKEFVKDLTE